MESRSRTLIVMALVAAAALAVVWLINGRSEASAPSTTDSAPAAIGVTAQPAVTNAAAASTPEPEPAATAAPATPSQREGVELRDPTWAVLRGRCVDADGTPLQGCTVDVHGWRANQSRMDAWLLEHAEPPSWTDPEQVVTGADGRFAFAFWPPPPFQFTVEVTAPGLAAVAGRWSSLAEGTTKDFGDVVLGPGVQVAGRVVDEQGVPQAKVSLQLRKSNMMRAAADELAARYYSSGYSKADGSFEVHSVLAAGDYDLSLSGSWKLRSADTVTLALTEPHQVIEVVVTAPAPRLQITGKVLDQNGEPAADVTVDAQAATNPRLHVSDHTGRDGAFTLTCPEGNGDTPVELRMYSHAYDCEQSTLQEVAWGTFDVELRVVRGGVLTLQVRDEGGAPIENYTVRLVPTNRHRRSSDDADARSQGRHEHGLVHIEGLGRGDWLLVVEFPPASGLLPLFEPFAHDIGGDRRIDLVAVAATARSLRVVNGAGEPIAGSAVQLCELFGQPLTDVRRLARLRQWVQWPDERNAVVVFEGATDGDGRITLSGMPGRELGLALLGPGHVPQRQVVRLDGADELVVTVLQGARLVGRVVPAAAVAELKRLAGVAPEAAFPARHRPSLSLANGTGERFPNSFGGSGAAGALDVADDGSFDANGLPAGVWQVSIAHWAVSGSSASGANAGSQPVELVEGQQQDVDIDLSAILPGTLEGLVLCNGEPVVSDVVSVIQGGSWHNLETDADGRFTHMCPPGEYRVMLQRKDGDGDRAMLHCPTPAVVVRGETTRQTFAVTACRLAVTVLGDDGLPRAGVPIQVVCDQAPTERYGSALFLPPTDARGQSQALVAVENVTLRVARKVDGDGAAAAEPRWLELARLALQPQPEHAVTVRLPEGSGY